MLPVQGDKVVTTNLKAGYLRKNELASVVRAPGPRPTPPSAFGFSWSGADEGVRATAIYHTNHWDRTLALVNFVSLAKPVPRVGHREGTILLSGHLDPIGLAVMDWRGRRAWPGRRGWNWIDRHHSLPIVSNICDEHSGDRVLLSA